MSHPDVIAIIVAAGRGSRFGADMPKQFCQLDSRPMLMTTIDRMAQAFGLEHVRVVIDASMADFWLSLCRENDFDSPRVVDGGATRFDSVYNAVKSLASEPDDTVVLVHDGARPMASANLVLRMAVIPDGCDGAIPAVPLSDSIRHLEGDGSVAVDRAQYVAVQTPQAFTLGTLRRAYAAASVSDRTFTDDASVVEFAGGCVALLPGEPTNIKVTNPLDMAVAETMLKHLTH